MRAFLSALRKEAGVTTIYAFNDPEDALALSDHLLVLINGRAVQYGTSREVFDRPVNRQVMELLSIEGVNALKVEVKNGFISPWNMPAPVPDGEWMYCFRPEEVDSDGPFRMNIESGTLKDGKSRIVKGKLADGREVRCVVPNEIEAEFSFRPTSPKFFPM
jgi:ABC-type sugar transport system ATPase subunit